MVFVFQERDFGFLIEFLCPKMAYLPVSLICVVVGMLIRTHQCDLHFSWKTLGSFLGFEWIQMINYCFNLWALRWVSILRVHIPKSKNYLWPLFPTNEESVVCVFGRRGVNTLGWNQFFPGVFSSRKLIPWGLTCIGLVTVTWFSPKQSSPANCSNSPRLLGEEGSCKFSHWQASQC